jgi:hypothetical protein
LQETEDERIETRYTNFAQTNVYREEGKSQWVKRGEGRREKGKWGQQKMD